MRSFPQVLHYKVAEEHPRVIDIIQSARNMNTCIRGENETQLMLRMHQVAVGNAGTYPLLPKPALPLIGQQSPFHYAPKPC